MKVALSRQSAWKTLSALLIVLLLTAPSEFAYSSGDDDIDDFEKEATKKKSEGSGDEESEAKSSTSSSSDDWWWTSLVIEPAAVGGKLSWMRVTGVTDPNYDVAIREHGEASLPFIGIEIGYMNARSDVDGIDLHAEVGYGPLGFQYRHTYLVEESPGNDLNYMLLHGLYRMTVTSWLEWDLGLGGVIVKGNERSSGFSLTLPFRVQPTRWVSGEFRPTWSWLHDGRIDDVPLTVGFGIRFLTVSGGYRWLRAGNARLDGPIVQTAFHY